VSGDAAVQWSPKIIGDFLPTTLLIFFKGKETRESLFLRRRIHILIPTNEIRMIFPEEFGLFEIRRHKALNNHEDVQVAERGMF
jgi:hypothetical protein